VKLVLYSDLHIRPERLEDCEKVLFEVGNIANSLAMKHGYDNVLIVNGGDTFNTRGVIRTNCFDRLYWHYSDWHKKGLKQAIIVGNHDQEDKAGEIHPMRVFSQFKGWHVIDKPKVIDEIVFFPYIEKKDAKEAIDSIKTTRKKPIAITHWGFIGAKRNDTNIDTDGIPLEWVSHFHRVFCGHYHYRNTIDNVQYIGSPLQQNFGEMGQDKGVLVYDTKTDKIEFVEIKSTPKHYEVNLSWEDGKEKYEGPIKEIREIDFVRLEVIGDVESVSNFSKERALKKIKVKDLKVNRHVKEKSFSRLAIAESERMDLKSLMTKYVDFVDTDLNKERLKKVGAMFVS
jgi:DNA repair exonuclease SbcCD nuclease subunit